MCILTACMIGVVTGCSSNSNFFTVLESANDIKSYKYKTELSIDLKAPSTAEDRDAALVMQKATSVGTFSIKLEGKIMESGAMSAAIAASLQSKDKTLSKYTTDGYLDITDIIYKEGILYVNMKQLAQAADKIGMSALFPKLTEDDPSYVKFENEETQSYINGYAGAGIQFNNDTLTVGKELGAKLYTDTLHLFDKIVKRVNGKQVLTENKGVYEVEINIDEVTSLCDAIIATINEDIDSYINSLETDLQSMNNLGDTQLVETVITGLKNYLSTGGKEELIMKLTELKENVKEITTFSLTGRTQMTGSKGNRYIETSIGFNGEVKHKVGDYSGLGITLKHKEQEIAYTDIVIIPTVYLTIDEYNSQYSTVKNEGSDSSNEEMWGSEDSIVYEDDIVYIDDYTEETATSE